MIGERPEWMLWTMFGLMAFIMAIPLLKALMPLPLPRSRPRIQARHPRSTHEIENQPATMAEAIPHDGRGGFAEGQGMASAYRKPRKGG